MWNRLWLMMKNAVLGLHSSSLIGCFNYTQASPIALASVPNQTQVALVLGSRQPTVGMHTWSMIVALRSREYDLVVGIQCGFCNRFWASGYSVK